MATRWAIDARMPAENNPACDPTGHSPGRTEECDMARSKRALAAPLLPVLAASLLLVLGATPLRASEADEASIEILRDTLHANKKALVAVNLALTDAEASAFWPVYDRYQQELAAVQGRLLQVIQDYEANFGKMTDEKADELVRKYLAVEQDRARIRQAYLEPISQALPGRKVMRFYQIENKIDAVLRYELAATIPVVEQ